MKTSSSTLCLLITILFCTADAQQRDLPRDRDTERRGDFVPQNDREKALLEMIKQLRSEVAGLRRQLQSRDGDRPRDGDRRSDRAARSTTSALMQKAKRIYAAYDKNDDNRVSFEEWLAMREGQMTDDRKRREQGYFSAAAGDDNVITLEEFARSMQRRARGDVREGGREASGPREGARDGDRSRETTRDGDRPRETTRDGDRPRERTRDGDRQDRQSEARDRK